MEILEQSRQRLATLEQGKETVLEHYARMVPKALDGLTPEGRQRFYAILRLKVTVEINGDLKGSGTFTMMWEPHAAAWAGLLRSDGWAG